MCDVVQTESGDARTLGSSLVATVAPSNGGSIDSLRWRDVELLARGSPTTRAVIDRTDDHGRADWLSRYRGGWQELLPNAGLGCTVGEHEHRFHGHASTAVWTLDRITSNTATMTLDLEVPPLRFVKNVSIDDEQPSIAVATTVECRRPVPVAMLWGHHPAFDVPGRAWIDVDAEAAVAARPGGVEPGRIHRWPIRQGPAADVLDGNLVRPHSGLSCLLYLPNIGGWCALQRDDGVGIAMWWDRAILPHLWVWIDATSSLLSVAGGHSLVALEPQRSWPADGLAPAIGRSRALIIRPGAPITARVVVAPFTADGRPVRSVDSKGVVTRD
jgi:galactose mutarotase-like enzyme